MRFRTLGFLAAFALTAILLFSGCKATAPAAQPSGPKKVNIGGTLSAPPADGKFVISGRKGVYTVEMAQAPVVRANSPVSKQELVEGSLVVVTGIADGSTIKATKIEFIRGKYAGGDKPVAAGVAPGG